MGGFIEGRKERVPGTKIVCNQCMNVLDESEFSFTKSKGYFSYCYKCHRIRLKEYREKQREENAKYNTVKRPYTKEIPSTDELCEYRLKLEDVAKKIRVGDIYKVKDRKLRVEQIFGTYVLMMWQGGVRECFIWDDVYKIINGTYRRSEAYGAI